MSSNPSSAGSTADPGKAQPGPQPPNTRQSLRNLWRVVVELWWRFFDWLAVVSWKTLLLVYVLLLPVAAILNKPTTFFLFIVVTSIVKVVAGGKHRAELTAREAESAAREAEHRADTEQLERAVVEARMQTLQAQIEPHFLFNTLASIDQLIQTDPPRASKMQQALIRYLRSAIPEMRDGARQSLGQQVELCRAFLEIMQMRMDERLQAVVNLPEGLKSAVFPPMMLQTLVENAIKHGLEPKGTGGTLTISAEIVDGQLTVQVCDDGVGFAPKGDGGVGLANIRERLKALYPGRAELIISVPSTGGTCATIKVPYEVAPPPTSHPERSEGSPSV